MYMFLKTKTIPLKYWALDLLKTGDCSDSFKMATLYYPLSVTEKHLFEIS